MATLPSHFSYSALRTGEENLEHRAWPLIDLIVTQLGPTQDVLEQATTVADAEGLGGANGSFWAPFPL